MKTILLCCLAAMIVSLSSCGQSNSQQKLSANKNDIINIEVELKDNDFLPIGAGMKVIYTPGHSLGHVCLLLEKENCLKGFLQRKRLKDLLVELFLP